MNKIYLILIFITLYLGSFVPLGKYLMTYIGPQHYLLTYMPLSYISLVLYIILNGNFLRLLSMRLRDIIQLLIWGVVFFFFAGILLYTALDMIPASTFGILSNLTPLIVVVLSYFFLKERISRSKVLGFGFAILGATIIIFTNSVLGMKIDLFGVLLAFIALFMLSTDLIIIKKMLFRYEPFQVMFYMYTGAVIAIIVYSAVWAGFIDLSSLPTHVIWLLLFWGFSAGVIELLLFYCISKEEVSKIVYFRYLNPVFVIVFSYLILHEVITFKFVIGAAFIFLGLKFVLNKK